MTSLEELLKQREALEAQIEKARKAERSSAIARVRALVEQYELDKADVFGNESRRQKAIVQRGGVAPKYRDAATGATWSGRGKAPRWIAGRDRSTFLIG